MSPKKTLLTVGLAAFGVLGSAATRAADPGASPAATGPPAAPASAPSPTHSVLLKTNGDVLSGAVTEESGRYLVRQAAGTIPVPKDLTERTFESLAAAYRYKRDGVPERDPDERLKLARWCLSHNMPAEAKAELQAVVILSPSAREAKAMLVALEAAEARAARKPPVDPGLVQTRGEATMAAEPRGGAGDARPGEIDAAVVRNAVRELGVNGQWVIFDLPPAVAVKRAEVFARAVNPVLVNACARCHNDSYPGTFQLVETRSRRGPSLAAVRANLDAALRLVDPESPNRSELLSRSLVPHPAGTRPIFRGSNDMGYKIISAWVHSLRAARPADGSETAREGPPAGPGGSAFAVDRSVNPAGVPAATTFPTVPNLPKPAPLTDRQDVLPATRYVPGQGMVVEKAPPPPSEFPAPYMLGGPKPVPEGRAVTPVPVPVPPPHAPKAPATAAPEPLPDLPAAAAAPPPPAAKPKAPLKLDMEALQKALSNRNGGR